MTTPAYDSARLDPLADALTALANANIISRPSDPLEELHYATVAATVAQAVALERIAECMESFLEAYTDTLTAATVERSARIWGS
jgi:hypothetical protein